MTTFLRILLLVILPGFFSACQEATKENPFQHTIADGPTPWLHEQGI